MYTETNRQLSYRKWIWDVHLLRNGFKSSRYDKVSHAHTHTHKRQQNDKTISPIIFSSVNRDTTTKAQPHKLIELNGKISQFPHNSIFRPLYLFCFSVIVYSHLRVIPLYSTHSFSVSTPPNSHTHTHNSALVILWICQNFQQMFLVVAHPFISSFYQIGLFPFFCRLFLCV